MPQTVGRTQRNTFELDPSGRLDFTVDWADWLTPGDTVSTVSWTVPSTLSKVDELQRQHTGTAQAGAAKTITLASGASATDEYYVDLKVRIIKGTGIGQTRVIKQYTGSTKVATVDEQWGTNPDSTSVYLISAATVWLSNISGRINQRIEVVNRITTAASPSRHQDHTLVIQIKEQ